MATSKQDRAQSQFTIHSLQFTILSILLTLLGLTLASCTAIRPVAKIGLLAPVEGLYRHSGYAALTAMRSALAERPSTTVDLMPLALDSSRDPLRAMQKILVDPAVRAVVGPLSLAAIDHVRFAFADREIDWIVPFAVDPAGGFAPVERIDRWAQPLVEAVAEVAVQQGCRRLLIAGWPQDWPSDRLLPDRVAVDIGLTVDEDAASIVRFDAIFYLGEPAAAATYAARLRTIGSNAPLYLGPQGEDPVFAEQTENSVGVYWLTWLDAGYAAWSERATSASPAAYQVYRATQRAMSAVTGVAAGETTPWHPQWFVYDAQGESQPVSAPTTVGCQVESS
jgi:hypothetical protein